MEFNETWQEARAQCPLPSLYISDRSVNKNCSRGRFIKRWHIVLRCTICGPLGLLLVTKSRRLVCNIVITRCSTSLKPLNRNQKLTKRDRKQELHVLHQDCVYRADRKNRMADGPRHSRILLWNRWTDWEFAETWQEAEFVFFGPIVKTRWLPALLLAAVA